MSLTKLLSQFFLPRYPSSSKVVVAESRAVSRYNRVASYQSKYHVHALGGGALGWFFMLEFLCVMPWLVCSPSITQLIHPSMFISRIPVKCLLESKALNGCLLPSSQVSDEQDRISILAFSPLTSSRRTQFTFMERLLTAIRIH